MARRFVCVSASRRGRVSCSHRDTTSAVGFPKMGAMYELSCTHTGVEEMAGGEIGRDSGWRRARWPCAVVLFRSALLLARILFSPITWPSPQHSLFLLSINLCASILAREKKLSHSAPTCDVRSWAGGRSRGGSRYLMLAPSDPVTATHIMVL